jgi:hypothetical protein
MRALVLVLCLIAATTCDEKSPVGPTIPLNQRFTLARSEVARVESTEVRVQFTAVTGDSRCPVDAICIQGGDAIVHIQVFDGSAAGSGYDLHTGDSARAAVSHGQMRIELLELQPYPFSSKTVAPDEYRATLIVTRP